MSSWPLEEQQDVISQLNSGGSPHTTEVGEGDIETADTKRTELEDQSADGTSNPYQKTERMPVQQKGKGRQQVDIDSSTATAPEDKGVSIYAELCGSADVVDAGDSGQDSFTSSSLPSILGFCPRTIPPRRVGYMRLRCRLQ